jgi:hypothetical protein
MAAAGDGRVACGKCGHLAIPTDKIARTGCSLDVFGEIDSDFAQGLPPLVV